MPFLYYTIYLFLSPFEFEKCIQSVSLEPAFEIGLEYIYIGSIGTFAPSLSHVSSKHFPVQLAITACAIERDRFAYYLFSFRARDERKSLQRKLKKYVAMKLLRIQVDLAHTFLLFIVSFSFAFRIYLHHTTFVCRSFIIEDKQIIIVP